MTFLSALANRGERVAAQRPWPRVVVDAATWRQAVLGIAAGEATLLGLWSDGEAVHLALHAEEAPEVLVISLPCPERRFPSVAATHPPALRLERTIRDLYGLEPEGSPDTRRWLDHGRWGVRQPLGAHEAAPPTGDPYAFHAATGPPLHQIPVGPVHAGIIEPGHFRFTCNGEAVVRLEERLGYVHKGVDGLMRDAPLEKAAKLAGRVSGDSTVAYAIAFARAVESALGLEPPPRAVFLRAGRAGHDESARERGDDRQPSTPKHILYSWPHLQVYLTPVAASILRITLQSFWYVIGTKRSSVLNSAFSVEPSHGKVKNASLIFAASAGSRLCAMP